MFAIFSAIFCNLMGIPHFKSKLRHSNIAIHLNRVHTSWVYRKLAKTIHCKLVKLVCKHQTYVAGYTVCATYLPTITTHTHTHVVVVLAADKRYTKYAQISCSVMLPQNLYAAQRLYAERCTHISQHDADSHTNTCICCGRPRHLSWQRARVLYSCRRERRRSLYLNLFEIKQHHVCPICVVECQYI